MKTLRELSAAAAMVLFANATQAAIVIYNFGGNVTSSDVVGTSTTFTGLLSYDSSAASFSDDPTYANYRAVASMSFTSGSIATQTIAASLASTAYVHIVNANPDQFVAETYAATGLTNDFNLFTFVLSDNSGLAYSSTELPLTLSLASDGNATIHLRTQEGGNINGVITALGLSSAVPEPASWAMMIGGFGMIGAVMRRKQKVSASFSPVDFCPSGVRPIEGN